MKQIAVITGDIIESSSISPKIWLDELRSVLDHYGNEEKDWMIYRGDSFQIRIPVQKALRCAITIKAAIKTNKSLDTRQSIGIGHENHNADKVTQSNGSAYNLSGRGFDTLKERRLSIDINKDHINAKWNLYLDLATHIMDQWQPKTAKTIYRALQSPIKTQKQIAKELGIGQSTVSEHLKRGGYQEILKLILYFEDSIVDTL